MGSALLCADDVSGTINGSNATINLLELHPLSWTPELTDLL
jgi:hypothetical protein